MSPECNRSPGKYILVILVVLLGSFLDSEALLIVDDPSELNGTTCQTALTSVWPLIYSGSGVDGLIVEGEFEHGRLPPINGSRAGKIVVYDNDWHGIFFGEFARDFQREGALALVVSTGMSTPSLINRHLGLNPLAISTFSFLVCSISEDEPGRVIYHIAYFYSHWAEFHNEMRIPIFQVTNENCGMLLDKALKNTDRSITFRGRITDEDLTNNFKIYRDSYISVVFQVLVLVPAFAGLLYAASKLIPTCMYRRKLAVPHVVLGLQVSASIFRILWAIDPHGLRGIYDPFTSYFLYTPSMAMVFVSDLVVLFYWNKAMNSFGENPFRKLEKWIYGVIGLIVVAEIVSAICRGFEVAAVMFIGVAIIYLLIIIGLISYIIYTIYQLQRYLKECKLTKKQEKARSKLERMNRLIVAIVAILSIDSIFLMFYFHSFFRRAITENVYWTIQFYVAMGASFCEVMLIRVPKPKRKSVVKSDENRIKSTRSTSNITVSTDVTSNTDRFASSGSIPSPTSSRMQSPHSTRTELDTQTSTIDDNGSHEMKPVNNRKENVEPSASSQETSASGSVSASKTHSVSDTHSAPS